MTTTSPSPPLLTVTRGDDIVVAIPITDETTGQPINLINLEEAWFTLATTRGGEILTTRTLTGGDVQVVDDDHDNTVRVHLHPEDTASAVTPWSVWWWELQLREPGGRISTPAAGRLLIEADTQQAEAL